MVPWVRDRVHRERAYFNMAPAIRMQGRYLLMEIDVLTDSTNQSAYGACSIQPRQAGRCQLELA